MLGEWATAALLMILSLLLLMTVVYLSERFKSVIWVFIVPLLLSLLVLLVQWLESVGVFTS
jgi:hypothetical protein